MKIKDIIKNVNIDKAVDYFINSKNLFELEFLNMTSEKKEEVTKKLKNKLEQAKDNLLNTKGKTQKDIIVVLAKEWTDWKNDNEMNLDQIFTFGYKLSEIKDLNLERLNDIEDFYSKVQKYGLEFMSWDELIGMEVLDKCIENLTFDVVSFELLYLLTSSGFSKEEYEENIKEFEESLLKSEKDIKEGKTFSAEEVFNELFEKYGFERKEKTEEEKRKEYEFQVKMHEKNIQIEKNLIKLIQKN